MLSLSDLHIISASVALGAESVPRLSPQEKALCGTPTDNIQYVDLAEAIRQGGDPLGDLFCQSRNAEIRRAMGATYTPKNAIQNMVHLASSMGSFGRIVDPGCGSGSFSIEALRTFQESHVVSVDLDPVASMMTRARIAASGYSSRARVIHGDYLDLDLEHDEGRTLFIGNPPYVRHHEISENRKSWLKEQCNALGLPCSKLAGLHLYFFIATLRHAKPGDVGVFITSSEWLDVNYGQILRNLLLDHAGYTRIDLLSADAHVFEDAMTTSAVTTFEVGSKKTHIYFNKVKSLDELKTTQNQAVYCSVLRDSNHWTSCGSPKPQTAQDMIQLGEVVKVHRGQVTGCNHVWITKDNEHKLPNSVLFRSITKAKEILTCGSVLVDDAALKYVIDLPVTLDASNEAIRRFLELAKKQNAHTSFTATHRKSWWSVGLRDPAPILCTYMARRSPGFVINACKARHINIAHGLYPKRPLTHDQLQMLVEYLSSSVSVSQGRTYAGGLTKFEPKEIERLCVPSKIFV